jgi:hypothetical protein
MDDSPRPEDIGSQRTPAGTDAEQEPTEADPASDDADDQADEPQESIVASAPSDAGQPS